jgi:hypothetical protein
MGRFASTVDLYEQLRPPYPPAFFRSVAERLKLSPQHALTSARGQGFWRLVLRLTSAALSASIPSLRCLLRHARRRRAPVSISR